MWRRGSSGVRLGNSMTFKEALYSTFRENYGTFQGRAPRSEYWFVFLFLTLLGFGLAQLLPQLGGLGFLFVVGLLCFVAGIIPFIALTVRRFHDVGLSGWWYLLSFVITYAPLGLQYSGILRVDEGIASLLVACVSLATFFVTIWPSHVGENKYGENPHYIIDTSAFE